MNREMMDGYDVHACNLNIWEAETGKFKVSLGFTETDILTKKREEAWSENSVSMVNDVQPGDQIRTPRTCL